MRSHDARAAMAHYTAVQDMANTEANAELVARVNAEAKEATRLPWWFWEAAFCVVVLTLLLSAVFPMGVAT